MRRLSRHRRGQRLAAGDPRRRRRGVALARHSRLARLQPPALSHAGARDGRGRGLRQPAGRRTLRLDDARGPVGRARLRRLLRHGRGGRHGGASFACRQHRLRGYCRAETATNTGKRRRLSRPRRTLKREDARMLKRLALSVALTLAAAAPSLAQTWPAKTVHIMVPFGAGSTPDTVARLIADGLGKKYPSNIFIVENKPGASGNIGTEAVAKAAPDGGTIGVSIGGPLAINTLLFSNLPYDPK